MAIELQNSMFIHIPKCGGRKVTTLLTTYVKGARIVGDRVSDAHKSPDTDKKVFDALSNLFLGLSTQEVSDILKDHDICLSIV